LKSEEKRRDDEESAMKRATFFLARKIALEKTEMCAHGRQAFSYFFSLFFARTQKPPQNTHQHAMDATEHTTLSSSQNIKEEYV
jgi:hypothetical protein